MKILHTADWHLGKRLENKLRLIEQEQALMELNELCNREQVDIIIVAGDVFDTSVPSAEAEELFYRSAVMLAKNRPLVVIAGNHDDADRLNAPFTIAKASDIYLVGGMDNTGLSTAKIEGGYGWLRYEKNGEILNLATLPFPARSRISGEGGDYPSFVSNLVAQCTRCFGDGINVFASHLYMDECLMSDERPGNAAMLTREVLPAADYCALGHIHKPQCVSKSKNAYYSGSLLKYHFDETDKKQFNIYDSKTEKVEFYSIKAGKQLKRIYATDYSSAYGKLCEAGDCYAELIYESATPLKPSEAQSLRAVECLSKMTIINKAVKRDAVRHHQSDRDIFVAYYQSVRGKIPSDEIVNAFLEVLNS